MSTGPLSRATFRDMIYGRVDTRLSLVPRPNHVRVIASTHWPRSSFRGAQRPDAITGAAPRKPRRMAEASASATQA